MTTEQLHDVRLHVNGSVHEVQVPARRLLSDALRHDCGLTGTHVGCEHGVCGACTVLVDGTPMRSCLIHEQPEFFAFYIFMNPYRANLIALVDRWPHWLCPIPSRFKFLSLVRDSEPVPSEWIAESEQMRPGLRERHGDKRRPYQSTHEFKAAR